MIAELIVAACIYGLPPFTRPDDACTPGDYDRLTITQVCTPKTRRNVPDSEFNKVKMLYHLSSWTGKDGEKDHRVPDFLGGRETAKNIWPERGSIPNPKDRLETYVRHRVCVDKNMRVRTARIIFLGDWTASYKKYQSLGEIK